MRQSGKRIRFEAIPGFFSGDIMHNDESATLPPNGGRQWCMGHGNGDSSSPTGNKGMPQSQTMGLPVTSCQRAPILALIPSILSPTLKYLPTVTADNRLSPQPSEPLCSPVEGNYPPTTVDEHHGLTGMVEGRHESFFGFLALCSPQPCCHSTFSMSPLAISGRVARDIILATSFAAQDTAHQFSAEPFRRLSSPWHEKITREQGFARQGTGSRHRGWSGLARGYWRLSQSSGADT